MPPAAEPSVPSRRGVRPLGALGPRIWVAVPAAVIVALGIFAAVRHGQAVQYKTLSSEAARQGDYTAAIADLRDAQNAWPYASQGANISHDQALLKSNALYGQGLVAFNSKHWSVAVQDLQGRLT